MAANPGQRARANLRCRLVPFEPQYAERVIGWVRDAREAYWFAPRTAPPLTAAEILAWQVPGHSAHLLLAQGGEPVGYGEVNRLGPGPGRYWLGHLIVDPAWRGQGYGRELSLLLLRHAFSQLRARRVTLVVFPENRAAIASYRAAGMREDGYETHEFPAYGRRACLLRMVATAAPPV